ncbi:MAG: ABC transporter ATP-binding protein/permease [Maricaulis sp.]|uniref:ABCB family ABC transporter ATP-binding protein/permease n=1 Tax=Maricaulis sp. TaxID=1486257 RepID=UPI001B163112|nr:ABC transporter ATP-binding protein/permease [Maricaulis sp.]MBO6730533.1 ABC transporter ATP-binding protein/permease [Maricaulis sp.]MBO6848196.1 ABC transporter ATP-binding protein/permease [Maricaulis sp.]MBO6877921.1 ABC transporter ATP-binding protein/permease [Maricaulis sp.]
MKASTPDSEDATQTAPTGSLGMAMARLFGLLASPEMQKWRLRMVVALALTIVAKLFAVAAPVYFGNGINLITERGEGVSVADAGSLFVVAFLAYAGARFLSVGMPQLRDAMFAPVSQDAQRLTQVRTFGHVQRLSLSYHQTKRTGALNRIIDRGARAVDFLMRFLVFNIAPTLFELVLAAGVLSLNYGWEFAAIAVVTVITYMGLTWTVTEWRVKIRRKMNDADNEANARAVDSLINFETVKAFAAERRETDLYDNALQRYAGAAVRSQSSLALLNGAQAFIMNAGLLAMALTAGWKAWNGVLQPGDVAAVTLILMNIYQPLNILGWAYREIKQGAVDMERLFDTLAIKPDVDDKPGAPDMALTGGAVRFDAVSFAHEGRERSVDAVSLDVPAGSFVGLCGPSGAGKSTMLKLLFRFYDPAGGAVSIDGQDLRDVTQESLRSALGLVPQDVVLFNDTLRANVLYGRPEASEDEILQALDRAQLGRFVRDLPDGLDTKVGERGLKLSGGEKQRVGVARAILKEPAVLVLDEATSALDSQTEKEVQAALTEAARGRTTIAVAHRLSTIANADRIVVMKDGGIAETGMHNALLELGGIYAEMWARQSEAGEVSDPSSSLQQSAQ